MRVAGFMAGVGLWAPITCCCRCPPAYSFLPPFSQPWSLNSTKISPSLKRTVPAFLYDPYKQVNLPSFEDEEEVVPELKSPSLPKEGRIDIVINNDIIKRLDLSPAHVVLKGCTQQIGDNTSTLPQDFNDLLERSVGFIINYEREDAYDIRELSEMSDVRLWFVRLDAAYPWLPVVLDWQGGELVRYTSMLVPHQISRRMGIVFNPEALQLFAMKKLFIVFQWLRTCKVPNATLKVLGMLEILGFKVDGEFFKRLETS